MSDLASLIAQLSGGSQQPASDPALAAVKLARASIDALVLKLGQTVDARVVGQLAAGLTQLSAGSESFVLKLETPLPAGTAVTIKVAANPQGAPTVTVSVPAATPQAAQPLPLSMPTAPPVQPPAPQQAGPAPAAPPPLPQAAQLPLSGPQPLPAPVMPAAVAPVPLPSSPLPQPLERTASPVPVAAQSQPQAAPMPAPSPGTAQSTQPAAPPVPIAPATASSVPAPGQPAAQTPLPVAPPVLNGAAVVPSAPVASTPALPVSAPVVAATPNPVAPPPAAPSVQPGPPPAVAAPQPAPILSAPLAAQPQQPLPTHPSPYPLQVPQVATATVAQQLPLPAAPAVPRAVAPPLNLADPAQAAARQDSAAPLMARLAALVTAAAPSLPRPVIEVALKALANRVDLNRGAPDAKTLETAVLRAGVLLAPPAREAPADTRSTLLALRASLLTFLGGDTTSPVAPAERPAPPLKGEPPRAPAPQAAPPEPSDDGHETARALLGHTDAALSRLKLLQSASQPADARPDAAVPRNELRVEIPMLLGAETGILQLLVERDGKQKRAPERQRGWRMRFAMNFSQTGEVGADIALLGHAASIAIWAADPAIADGLDLLLPELAPAIQRHGLELTSLRVRRGAPRPAQPAPGQLLDSAR